MEFMSTGLVTSLLPPLVPELLEGFIRTTELEAGDGTGGGGGGGSSAGSLNDGTCWTVWIPKESTLFQSIQQAANATQPIGRNVEVLEVKGVVNPSLMSLYQVAKEGFAKLGFADEFVAWHGTGDNDTTIVATSETGLDSIYCSDGHRKYFGQATYVSTLLSYTHNGYVKGKTARPPPIPSALFATGTSVGVATPSIGRCKICLGSGMCAVCVPGAVDVPADELEKEAGNKRQIYQVILCHVIPGKAEVMQEKQPNFGLPALRQMCKNRGDKFPSTSVICTIDGTIMRALYHHYHIYPTFIVTYALQRCVPDVIDSPFVPAPAPAPASAPSM